MPDKKEAQEFLNQYLKVVGTNCEHDSYCTDKRCLKLGYTFCRVDFEKAKDVALIHIDGMISFIESHNNEWFGWKDDLNHWKKLKYIVNSL